MVTIQIAIMNYSIQFILFLKINYYITAIFYMPFFNGWRLMYLSAFGEAALGLVGGFAHCIFYGMKTLFFCAITHFISVYISAI
jgi:hypothetical protein